MGGVNPAEGRVCFIVDADGSCNGGKVEKFKQDCSARGYTQICDTTTQDAEGGSCTQNGTTYHKRCKCKSGYDYVKPDNDNMYDYEDACTIGGVTKYKYKTCKSAYKYAASEIAASGHILKATTCGNNSKPGGNECVEVMVDNKPLRYDACVCDTSTYKYTTDFAKQNKAFTNGEVCTDSSKVSHYKAPTCSGASEDGGFWQDSCDSTKQTQKSKANAIDGANSIGVSCSLCEPRSCSSFTKTGVDGYLVVDSTSTCDSTKGFKNGGTYKPYEGLTCRKCNLIKTCQDANSDYYERDKITGGYKPGTEHPITYFKSSFAISSTTGNIYGTATKKCYERVPVSCSEYGGLTLAEKEAEPSAKTALYNYKTSSEAGVDTNGVTCYFRSAKQCSELTYIKQKGSSTVTDTYSSSPVSGVRIEAKTISFPDDYEGAKTSICFTKHENCVVGDLLTGQGSCLPKSDSGNVWGWNGNHDFSSYGSDAGYSRLGIVTKVSITNSETSSSVNLRYVTFTLDQYYPFYKDRSTSHTTYQSILNRVMKGEVGSDGKCWENDSCKETPGGFRYALSEAKLWDTEDAQVLINHLDDFKALGGQVHNARRQIVGNLYGTGKAESRIYAKECYYVVPNTKTSGVNAKIRRVILDSASSGVVSSSNRNNPRFLYGRHAYATGSIAEEVLYGGGTGLRLSKLEDFMPAWNHQKVIQPERIYRALADKDYYACANGGGKPNDASRVSSNVVFDDVEDLSVYYCSLPMYFYARNSCDKSHTANTGVPEANCWRSWPSTNTSDGISKNGIANYSDISGWTDLARSGIQGCYVKQYNTLSKTVTRNKFKDLTSGGLPTVPGGSIPGGGIPGGGIPGQAL